MGKHRKWMQEEVDYVVGARHALVPLQIIAEKLDRSKSVVAALCATLKKLHGEVFPEYEEGRGHKRVWLSPAEKRAKGLE